MASGVVRDAPQLRAASIGYKAINSVVLMGFTVGRVAPAITAVGR